MSYLSGAQLAAMRAELQRYMTSTATVLRPTTARTASGGTSSTPSAVHTGICRIRPLRQQPAELLQGERTTARELWAITWPAATDVRVTDRIQWTAPDATVHLYEVLGVHGPKSDELSRRAICVEVL